MWWALWVYLACVAIVGLLAGLAIFRRGDLFTAQDVYPLTLLVLLAPISVFVVVSVEYREYRASQRTRLRARWEGEAPLLRIHL